MRISDWSSDVCSSDRRMRWCCDVLALFILTAMAVILAAKACGVAATSYSMQALASSSLRTPLAIPQAMWAAALCWFSFILIIQCLRAVLQLAQRDWAGISRNYGVPSINDEIEEEQIGRASCRERVCQYV